MKKYTVEELKLLNPSYHLQHVMTEEEVTIVNEMVAVIEATRDKRPVVGDVVQYTTKRGDFYENAHIDELREDGFYICENPYTPFCSFYKHNGFSTTTSGGAWTTIPCKLEYVGKAEKTFTVWGRHGACGNGAVDFKAEVHVWRYSENEGKYSTKFYDKHYLFIQDDEQVQPYKYFISNFTSGASNESAFRSNEEYEAWLKTFHGIELDGVRENQRVIWTYKQSRKFVPLDEYLKIESAVLDSELCNGVVQECKRIIEGTRIQTIIPYQNEMIPLDGEKVYRNAYL